MQHQPGPQQEQSQLVIRPIVKHIAIGLGVTALLGILEYSTYALGVQHGYTDGVSSAIAEKNVNQKAEGKLMSFMQSVKKGSPTQASATTATVPPVQAEKMEDLSMNAEGAAAASVLPRPKVVSSTADLQWITDDVVRAEAQWTLALASITQGKVAEADALLRDLFSAKVPLTKQRAERAALAAQAFVSEKHYAESAYYYDYLDRYYASVNDNEARLALIKKRIALLPLYVTEMTALQHELTVYLKNASKLGNAGRELAYAVFAWKGYLYRAEQTAASREKAEKCFEYALKSTTPQLMPELLQASISHAAILSERTQNAQAVEMLRAAVAHESVTPEAMPYITWALRELARVEQAAGNTDTALSLLYRVEGLLLYSEAADSVLWNYLYDQRGRLHLEGGNVATAAADFEKAMQNLPADSALLPQPMEGAARCCMQTDQYERALELMARCVELRKQHAADDKQGMFRALALLAELQDALGDAQAASVSYGEAIAHISAKDTELSAEEVNVLRAYAFVLSQLKQWTEAGIAWERLNHASVNDEILMKEIKAQLELCKSKGAVIPAYTETESDEDIEEDSEEV